MGNSKNTLYIPIIFFLLLSPASLLGQEIAIPRIPAAAQGNFVLSVENELLSLQAQEASLKTIVEEIGRKMGIEVLGNIPDKETISIEFEELPLAQALERLSSNYGYQMTSEKGGNKVAKIFVLPKGTGTGLSRQALKESEPVEEPEFQISERVIEAESAKGKEPDKEKPSRPEPFKFEFDPSAFMK